MMGLPIAIALVTVRKKADNCLSEGWFVFIPTLGTIYSHVGNNSFPSWKHLLFSLDTSFWCISELGR